MKCELCKKFVIPDDSQLCPRILEICEGEEFIVHSICGEKLQNQVNAIKGNKKKNAFLDTVLKKLSN